MGKIITGSSNTDKTNKPGLRRAEFRTQTNDSSYSELDDMILNGDTGTDPRSPPAPGGVLYGVQTGGVLSVKLIRLNFKGSVGLFGRKANPYVKATYGDAEKLSPTYVCDNNAPLNDKALAFKVTDVNSLIFEVFDRDTTDSSDNSSGVLMGRATVDIKEWVANGRFEGEQKLQNREGIDAGDSIQLAVKITYPKEEQNNGKKKIVKLTPIVSPVISPEASPRSSLIGINLQREIALGLGLHPERREHGKLIRERSVSFQCSNSSSSRVDSPTGGGENWMAPDEEEDEDPLFKQEDRIRIFMTLLGKSFCCDKYESPQKLEKPERDFSPLLPHPPSLA